MDQKADFFTVRHTGATQCAERATDKEELMRVVNMMGDTNVETVGRHYFNFQYEDEEDLLDGWELPVYDPTAAAGHASPSTLRTKTDAARALVTANASLESKPNNFAIASI